MLRASSGKRAHGSLAPSGGPWLRAGAVFQSVLPFSCFRPFNLRKNCLKILPFLCFTLSNIVQKPKTRRRESRKVSPDGSKNCAIISLSFAPMTKKCAHYFDVSKASFLALFLCLFCKPQRNNPQKKRDYFFVVCANDKEMCTLF